MAIDCPSTCTIGTGLNYLLPRPKPTPNPLPRSLPTPTKKPVLCLACIDCVDCDQYPQMAIDCPSTCKIGTGNKHLPITTTKPKPVPTTTINPTPTKKPVLCLACIDCVDCDQYPQMAIDCPSTCKIGTGKGKLLPKPAHKKRGDFLLPYTSIRTITKGVIKTTTVSVVPKPTNVQKPGIICIQCYGCVDCSKNPEMAKNCPHVCAV